MTQSNYIRLSDSKSLYKVSKSEIKQLYSNASLTEQSDILDKLGPLKPVFARFIKNEQNLEPMDTVELIKLFDSCSDKAKHFQEITDNLRKLAPGSGRVGFQQVNILVDHLRRKVSNFIQENRYNLELIPHAHAFGSGGDFKKTIHATTNASIVVAPLATICKTGTRNVTSAHGSHQVMKRLGYNEHQVNTAHLNNLLCKYNFAFVSLASLGFPYSDALRKARKNLWDITVHEINHRNKLSGSNWQETIKNVDIPIDIDIFKVVSPNAQVLNPVYHSTGICHLSMIPYVIGIYLHLNSNGIISHCYDGIDEISNAYFDKSEILPNNLVVKVDDKNITIAEFSPEAIGIKRASFEEIEEKNTLDDEIGILHKIISGRERGAQRDFVIANAAVLLVASNKVSLPNEDLVSQIKQGVRIATDLIDSGKSYDNFKKLQIEMSIETELSSLIAN